MTPIVLLDNLAEFVKEKTADIILQVRVQPGEEGKERAAEEGSGSTDPLPFFVPMGTAVRLCRRSLAFSRNCLTNWQKKVIIKLRQ